MKQPIPAPEGHLHDPLRAFFNNNFDLLRLLAASQVVLCNHYANYFGYINLLQGTLLGRYLTSLSGVPIFFFISGFLISASLERNQNLLEYTQNRCLRIFPAFWVCFIISIGLVLASGYEMIAPLKTFCFWLATQFIFPVYNPDFLRDYGVGVLNGSLWTIPVELQFYAVLPIF